MTSNNKYKYEKLAPDARQYDDIDLSVNKIVKAKYVDTYAYRGNRFIEALPFAMTEEEVLQTYNRMAELPPKNVFYKLRPQQQDMVIDNIENRFRVALPFHEQLEEAFSNTLVQSYAHRIPDNKSCEIQVQGETFSNARGLKAYHAGEATIGFSMLGVAGSGKSTALNMVLDHYPQVIIHESEDETVVQIVYLFVTCRPLSNFTALYEAIGKAIDDALGNGNNLYQNEITRIRRGGLGAKTNKIIELIEKLNIGIIIFDEIQYIDLNSTRENSIESLLTINNETHVGIGVLGTEDAFHDLFSRERTARRLSNYVPASRYCNNMATFRNIIQALFLNQIFLDKVKVTNEIVQAFYAESEGVIHHAVLLYCYVLKDYVHMKNKPIVNADFILKIGKSRRKIIHDIIYKNRKQTNISVAKRKKLIEEMNSYNETEESKNGEHEFNDSMSHNVIFSKDTIIQSIAESHKQVDISLIEAAVDEAVKYGVKDASDGIELAGKLLENSNGTLKSKSEKQNKTTVDMDAILLDLTASEVDQ